MLSSPKNLIKASISFVLFSILIISSAGEVFPESQGHGKGSVEILWDTWGVPHIYAENEHDLFYGFGWAQMEADADLILRLCGKARGRAAEYWGEEFLESDRFVHLMGVPGRAVDWYNAQRPDFKECLDSFVNGINDYAKKNLNKIAEDVRTVLPVTPVDIMAHTQNSIHLTYLVWGVYPGAVKKWEETAGSNTWAIGPGKTESGNSMLLINPHLLWQDKFTWFEVHLNSPNLSGYGATFVGLPNLILGFNDNLGWSHTINTVDGADLFELVLKDDGYMLDGKIEKFTTIEKILKVKQKDGTINQEKMTIEYSKHGPVLGKKGSKALAVRIAGLDRPYASQQWINMLKAKNISEFEQAIKGLEVPKVNFVYADKDGHIMYYYGNPVPVKSEGDYNYWQGVVPGDRSNLIWTGIHSYNELPRVIDPPSGWVQNANDGPWFCTYPGVFDPGKFPAYLAPRGIEMRPQRSIRMLHEDPKISYDELIEYKHSTRMELADHVLDDLIAIAEQSDKEILKRSAAVFKTWDRSADSESRGALLFQEWMRNTKFPEIYSVQWNEGSPLDTPKGISDKKSALEALEKAASSVLDRWGALDIKWGEVHRFQHGNVDYPGNGGTGFLGIFRVVHYIEGKDSRKVAAGGDSFYAAVEFSEPLKVMACLVYGNSSQPDSSHLYDQLKLFAQKRMRKVWLSRKEIENNIEKKESLKIEK